MGYGVEDQSQVEERDRQQRSETGRKRGWFDKSIFLNNTNGFTLLWTAFAEVLCKGNCVIPWEGRTDVYSNDFENELDESRPCFMGWTERKNKVIRFQTMPPLASRNPNYFAMDEACQTSDGIIIFVDRYSHPGSELSTLEGLIKGRDYSRYRDKGYVPFDPKPPKTKTRALVVVFCCNGGRLSTPPGTGHGLDLRAEWEVICESKGYPYFEFDLGSDATTQKEMALKILDATVKQINRGKGLTVKTEFCPHDYDTGFKELNLQPKKKRGFWPSLKQVFVS